MEFQTAKKLTRGFLGWFCLVICVIAFTTGKAPAAETAPAVTDHDSKGYVFSKDWFSGRIPLWEHLMEPYVGKPGLNYLEIGVFEGRSLIWMLENVLTAPTARATAIDIFPDDLEEQFRENIRKSGFPLISSMSTVRTSLRTSWQMQFCLGDC
jgi:hypothetical protein